MLLSLFSPSRGGKGWKACAGVLRPVPQSGTVGCTSLYCLDHRFGSRQSWNMFALFNFQVHFLTNMAKLFLSFCLLFWMAWAMSFSSSSPSSPTATSSGCCSPPSPYLSLEAVTRSTYYAMPWWVTKVPPELGQPESAYFNLLNRWELVLAILLVLLSSTVLDTELSLLLP